MSLLYSNTDDLIIIRNQLIEIISDLQKRIDILTNTLSLINNEIEGRKY